MTIGKIVSRADHREHPDHRGRGARGDVDAVDDRVRAVACPEQAGGQRRDEEGHRGERDRAPGVVEEPGLPLAAEPRAPFRDQHRVRPKKCERAQHDTSRSQMFHRALVRESDEQGRRPAPPVKHRTAP